MKLESGTTILPPDRSKRLLEAKAAGLPDGALWTYLELAKITNLTGANRWRFVETLADQLEESPRTIRHYCSALEAAGLIERERGQVAAFTNGRTLPAIQLEHGKLLPIVKTVSRQRIAGTRQIAAAQPSRSNVQHARNEPLKEEGIRKEDVLQPLEATGKMQEAMLELHQALTSSTCRTVGRKHFETYLERRTIWRDTLPAEYILAVVRKARTGSEVKRDSWGALVFWLENVGAAPEELRAILNRQTEEPGSSPAKTSINTPEPTGQITPGLYCTAKGFQIEVLEVRDGEVTLANGESVVLPLTRGWTRIESGPIPPESQMQPSPITASRGSVLN
jgi:hypothetical protein